MAEFSKVVKDWRRMCDFVSAKNYDMHCSCIGCPVYELSEECNGCDAIFTKWAETLDWGKFEKIVEQWAEEHPEPVYPTWLEWLEQVKVAGRAYEHEPYFTGDKEIYSRTAAFTPKVFEPIPADIAQKLGIEPKEGV